MLIEISRLCSMLIGCATILWYGGFFARRLGWNLAGQVFESRGPALAKARMTANRHSMSPGDTTPRPQGVGSDSITFEDKGDCHE